MPDSAASAIRVRCPHCEAILKSSPAVAGRNVRCPKCSQPFHASPETVVTTGGTSQSELVTPIRDEERLDPFAGWDIRPNPVTARRSPPHPPEPVANVQGTSQRPVPPQPKPSPEGDQFFASRYARRPAPSPIVLIAAAVAVIAGVGLGILWTKAPSQAVATRDNDDSIQLERRSPAKVTQSRNTSDSLAPTNVAAGVIGLVALLAFGFIGLAIYLAPTFVAHFRGHANFAPILIVNVALGWTFVTWILCLAWAFNSDTKLAKEIHFHRD
jgi:predicted Zn finger-like uncharacterized protein